MSSPATCRLASPEAQIAAQHAVIARFETAWEFGLAEQLELMDSLASVTELGTIVGTSPRDSFGHKGQAMMRNIAYLKLAQMQESDVRLHRHGVSGITEDR